MTSAIVKLAADVLWELGRKAMAHSRKLSPRQLKQEFARWDRPHMPAIDGRCVICGKPGAPRDVPCPGSPAQQRARAELARGDDELRP